MPKARPFAIIRRVVSSIVLGILVLTLVLILKKAPPPQIATSPAAAAMAERKLDAADQAAASGQPAQVQLDNTELNSYFAQNLQLAGSDDTSTGSAAAGQATNPAAGASAIAAGADPQTVADAESAVRDVKIDLADDLVKTYVIFNFHGKDLSLELDGHLYAQDGYLRFDPVGGKIGSFPLPQSALKSAVQRMMNSPENRDKLRLPENVSNIEVENSHVVVSYK